MWKYKTALLPLAIGLTVSAILFYTFNWWGFLIIFPWIGFSVSMGAFLRKKLKGKKRLLGRKITLIMILPCLLFFVPISNNENFQLEGVALIVLVGFFNKGFIHYAVAKIFGPLIWRRGFCGHACWTAAVLDWLPINNRPQDIAPKYKNIRYLSLLISLLLPLVLIYVMYYNPYTHYIHKVEMKWMFISNAIYYLIAIPLAFILTDKRAFCKYVCPVALVMKPTSRFGLIKIAPNTEKECIGCNACTKNCSMGINVMELMQTNQSVTSTECIMCNDCCVVCPTNKING